MCIESCPAEPSGNATADCVASCPAATSGAGRAAATAFDMCRNSGARGACPDCGHAVDAGPNRADAAGTGGGDARPKNPIVDQSCPDATSTDPCTACKETHCCETRARCNGDPSCSGYIDCMAACVGVDGGTVSSCVPGCDRKYPGAFLPYNEQLTCVTLFCPKECGGVSPGPCEACTDAKCARAQADCEVDASCARFAMCLGDCSDSSCQAACAAPYSEVTKNLGLAIGICATNNCGSVCPL